MTIEERLDRLTERHEAPASTVELLTRDLQTQRANLDRQAVTVD